MKRIFANRKYIFKLSIQWICSLYTFLGFISMFISLSEIIPNKWTLINKILVSFLVLLLVWLICFIVNAIRVVTKKQVKVLEANNGKCVYVQYGDLFDKEEISDNDKQRIIVIPVNRCFDTIVDNEVVSDRTLHGITFKKLYDEKKYNQNSLNKKLQEDLTKRQHKKPIFLNYKEKPKGNVERFGVGDVAELDDGDIKYFFLALSTFDKNLTAHTSKEDYVVAMQRLIEYCNARSQGLPILLPMIGAGLSRTKNSERDSLEYMLKLLKINKDFIIGDIHIVIRKNGKETVPIIEL